MADSREKIIHEMRAYILSHGGGWGDWYVGIAENINNRLGDHRVTGEPHISKVANSPEIARAIEDYFIHKLKTDGSHGGNKQADKVYAYKKSRNTRQGRSL
jgi:hypothetical protein